MRRFSPRSFLLLSALSGICLHGQASLPPGSPTPDLLGRFCAAQRGSSCTVPLDGQYTLTLTGPWHLPASMHLRFAAGSTLHITGGVLQFDGGSVEAPANEPVFPDGDRIRGLAAARPEWFLPSAVEPGQASDEQPVPAAALAAAYQATEPWGTIYLRARRYVSPFSGCPSVAALLRYLSPRTLVGEGRSSPDDPTRPNRLQGGTILLGGIMGTAAVRAAHLGIDVGPDVSTHVLQGCQPPGIFIEQPDRQFVSGDRLEDVSVLTTGAFNMHSVMIAGHQDVEVRDLWIWTRGGTHGLVMKSRNSVVDGLHCWGAVSDCLIVKSDYATDFLGRADHDRVSHVEIHPLTPEGFVGGIVVESRWDVVRSLDIQDIHEDGTLYGLTLLGSNLFRPRDISVSNWTADRVLGMCLFADRADAVRLANFRCGLLPSAQPGVLLQGGRGTLLQNGLLTCEGSAVQCAAGRTDAVRDLAGATSLQGITAQGLGGYLLRSPDPPAVQDRISTVGMDGRAYLPFRETWRTRFEEDRSELKPTLRILYTAVMTRLAYRPGFYTLLAALLVAAVVLEITRRRRFSRRSR